MKEILFIEGTDNHIALESVIEMAQNWKNQYHITLLRIGNQSNLPFTYLDVNIDYIYPNNHFLLNKLSRLFDAFFKLFSSRNPFKSYLYHRATIKVTNEFLTNNHKKYHVLVSMCYSISHILVSNNLWRKKTLCWLRTKINNHSFKSSLYKYQINKAQAIITSSNIEYQKFRNLNTPVYFLEDYVPKSYENLEITLLNKKENIISILFQQDLKPIEKFLESYNALKLNRYWKVQLLYYKTFTPKPIIPLHFNSQHMTLKPVNDVQLMKALCVSKVFINLYDQGSMNAVLQKAMFTANILLAFERPIENSQIINPYNGKCFPIKRMDLMIDQLKRIAEDLFLQENWLRSSFSQTQNYQAYEIINQWDELFTSIKIPQS